MTSKADFHIPSHLCKEKCKMKLEKLTLNLKRAFSDINCPEDLVIYKYPTNGSNEQLFRDAFNSSTFTIIHECKYFWEKIKDFQTLLEEGASKVMCVTFNINNKQERRHRDNDHNHFFSKFKVTNIADDAHGAKFAKDAIRNLCQYCPTKGKVNKEELVDREVEKADRYENLRDVYSSKLTDIKVLNSRLKLVERSEKRVTWLTLSSVKMYQAITEASSLEDKKFIFLKVLPERYAALKKDSTSVDFVSLVDLAYMAVCDNYRVASTAALMLQLTLIRDTTLFCGNMLSSLIIVETLLWEKLFLRYKRMHQKEDEMRRLIKMLKDTYIMVLCHFILISIKTSKNLQGDTHLDTICGRLLPTSVSEDEEVAQTLRMLTNFLQNLNNGSCKKYKKDLEKLEEIIEELEEEDRLDSSTLEDELTLDQSNGIIVASLEVYKILKEVFKSAADKHLESLKLFIDQQNEKICHGTSTTLALHGLTLFIVFQLKNATVQDIEALSTKLMDMLEIQFTPYVKKMSRGKKMDPFLQMFYFNPIPFVRKLTMTKTTKTKTTKQKDDTTVDLFTTNSELFTLNQMKSVLWPLMEFEPDDDVQNECKGWISRKGYFDSSAVMYRMHIPTAKNLQDQLKTSFLDDDPFYNELVTLERLQHENIVKMIAFQKQCIPQFYILEQFPSLQEDLNNRRERQDYIEKCKLINYLIQALNAVQFCHSRNYAHCKLTAGSLLRVSPDHIKLSDFQLCVALKDGKAVGKVFTKHLVPVRWSSPESIQLNEYSEASDVWMFGHLIYEVLTHGDLPYKDLSDNELLEKMSDEDLTLSEHPLIKQYYNLITECSDFDKHRRCQLDHVRRVLEQKETTFMYGEERVEFEDLKGNKPSIKHLSGIPEYSNSDILTDPVLKKETVTDTLTKYTLDDAYIFLEKIVYMEDAEKIRLKDGLLEDIMPHITIKQVVGEMPHAICKVQRVSTALDDSIVEGSFDKIVKDKMLGDDIKPYINCLHQAALLIESLHSKCWIIGDICLSNIFIQKSREEDIPKVFIVSITYLQFIETERDNGDWPNWSSTSRPLDIIVKSRAAPEVADFGTFSFRSDIYCFANLMWETIEVFSDLHDDSKKEKALIASLNTNQLAQKWETRHLKPTKCPDRLYELMQSCTSYRSAGRITATQLVQTMNEMLQTI